MPFEEKNGRVEIIRPYGEDADGNFNHGVDFKTRNFLIAAVADGQVCGAMNSKDGAVMLLQHGDYLVTYSHLKTRFAQVDQKVKAGMVVGMASDSLHVEVKYQEQEINPMEFLTMIYGNIKMLLQTGKVAVPDFETIDMDVPTDFDENQEEIERLMLQWYPSYLADLAQGEYLLPGKRRCRSATSSPGRRSGSFSSGPYRISAIRVDLTNQRCHWLARHRTSLSGTS